MTPISDEEIFFLDESGFNLHISSEYGYSQVSIDAVKYQVASKGRNLSLMMIIGLNGIVHWEILRGAYNRTLMVSFIRTLPSHLAIHSDNHKVIIVKKSKERLKNLAFPVQLSHKPREPSPIS